MKLCVCLLCAVGLALGTGGEIGRPGAQRNPYASGGIVLHAALVVLLCIGAALTRVVNAGAQEGLEAWRAPVLHREPASLTHSAGLLQGLLNFSFEGEIAGRRVQFDRDIDRYWKASGENFPEQH